MAGGAAEGRGRRVTRDVEPAAVQHLIDDPPRATVAFVGRGGVDLLPVRARYSAGTHRFGVLAGAAPDLEGREVVLLMDDGAYWFELRGTSVRGVARRVDPPRPGEAGRLAWYAIEPRRILAWDYGAIREVSCCCRPPMPRCAPSSRARWLFTWRRSRRADIPS